MKDVAEFTARLEVLRKKIDEVKEQKTRLEIEKANCLQRKKELEERSKLETGIDIADLEKHITELSDKIESDVKDVEKQLGIVKG